MNTDKGFKESFARFFEEPTREGLREVLRDNLGEANEIDFKVEWPENTKLARHVLGLANFGGGCIVVGVAQSNEAILNPIGLSALTDKTKILKDGIAKYVPDTLMRQLDILDFAYQESEYPKLRGKSFQVLLVGDDPAHLPFVATADGGEKVRSNAVYTRRGVATVEANHEELQRIISRRLETGYSSRRELDLRDHMEQLRVLYEQLSPHDASFLPGITGVAAQAFQRARQYAAEQFPNPNYPEEDYETFVARTIARKKRRIEVELEIEDFR